MLFRLHKIWLETGAFCTTHWPGMIRKIVCREAVLVRMTRFRSAATWAGDSRSEQGVGTACLMV
jgi:hypothetical protein